MLKKFTEDTFDNDIGQGTTLVDFYADWCGPCRMMTPILEQLSQEMKDVTIGKIDVDHAQRIASSYQVTSIPTLILFKNGKEMGRVVGLRDAAALKEFIHSAAKTRV
ncbi:MAG: thioredoxin [Verrucomicrobia bacterium]|nr:thioredoxin [Verrucomicrobiota bacterium]